MHRFTTVALVILLLCVHPVTLPGQRQAPNATPRFLHLIKSRTEFDQLARIYYRGRFYALPHLMFVIDRSEKGKVYYVNSRLYSFHKDFVNANYLSLERGKVFFEHNYLEQSRRFLLGTIAFQPTLNKFTFEFWEGDQVSPALISETYRDLSSTFYTPVHFKPNSSQQEARVKQLTGGPDAVPFIRPEEAGESREYTPLHEGKAVGVLRVIDKVTGETIIDRNEIVIFRESPISLTPLSGVITVNPSTPLSHVNLLAAGWGIPNACIRNADELFKPLIGKFVYYEAREDGFVLRQAEVKEAAEAGRKLAERSDLLTPPADLEFTGLTLLANQRRTDVLRFGAKSANLGELMRAARAGRITGITVPPGFSIPFHYYQDFVDENRLDAPIVTMLANDRFNHDAKYRKEELAKLRARIQTGTLSPGFRETLRRRVAEVFGPLENKGVFARSSTNSEDLPNFSGAGLYTSVPNIKGEAALEEAVKTVWASLWNYEAYEARERAGINHSAVYPAVLVQEGINADAAGVMITADPFDKANRGAVYINAKRGLGMRVVEGEKIAEQVIFHGTGRRRPVTVLSRSGDDTMLKFDQQGGVREVRIETSRVVLTDRLAADLARAALQIKRVFGGKDQDIEWLISNHRVYIVQSRPWIRGG